jgi:hypothetical protein
MHVYEVRPRRDHRGVELAPAAAPLPLAGAVFPPAGLADGDLFRLKKFGNRNLNLRGVAVGTGVGVALGETAAAVL